MSSFYLLTIACLSIASWICPSTSQKIEDADVEKWVTGLSNHLTTLSTIMKASNLQAAVNDYASKKHTDPDKVRDDIVKAIEDKVVKNRAKIVSDLSSSAEQYHENNNVTNLSCENSTYYRAKAISDNETFVNSQTSTEKCQRFESMNLTDDPIFYNIGVNTINSTAHVPTNVYDGSKPILMVADWTKEMDNNFKKNLKDSPALKWQYFGSTEGMMRIYPGVKWHVQINQIGGSYPVDFFDCRSLPWYTMAAACPKQVVILVDKSGSMTGKRVIIANRTITEIILSLTENDFFNVIHVNQTVGVVDPAYNETMIQASMRNKHRVIQLLNLEAKGITNYSLGLTKAFEMLSTTPETTPSANGYSKALFVVGDGVPFPFSNLCKDCNKDKSVRIFSYLIGTEATEVTNMRNMACNNDGFYAHIMTLSDVKENVLKYLPVMARAPKSPLTNYIVWTGPHVREVLGKVVKEITVVKNTNDTITTTKTRKTFEPNTLFASVAKAAIDKKKGKTLKYFPLLGVAGVDVPVADFIRHTQRWSLGTLGYVFMVNNNGYVLFHPNFRPTFNDRMKPFFENTDLARVEHPTSATSDNGHPTYDMEVRKKMVVDRAKGSLAMEVYNIPDDFKSAFKVNMKYFFAPVANTPYSIGVAMEWSGSTSVGCLDPPASLTANLDHFAAWLKDSCPNSTQPDGVLITPYEFCNFQSTAAEFQRSPLCALRSVLLNATLKTEEECDEKYINLLQQDATKSEKIFTNWKSEESKWTTYDIDQVFALFHSGLLKYYNKTVPREESFIAKHSTRAMQDDLFQTTHLYSKFLGKPELLYFHPPTPQESQTNSSITVTRVVHTKEELPVAVVGLQIGFEKLKSRMLEITSAACTTTSCLRCNDTNVDCYLVATNGYIVVAGGNDSDAGKFFATVDPEVMSSMINDSLFNSEIIYDFQAVCNYSSGQKAFASKLIDPITLFLRWVTNIVCTVGIFVAQLFITLFWALISTAEVNPPYNVTREPAWNSCSYKDTVYLWKKDKTALAQNDINTCTGCSKTWKAKIIDNTNLILLAVSYGGTTDRQCSCNLNVATSEKLAVNRSLLIKTNRKYPDWTCGKKPAAQDEENAVCSQGIAVSTPQLLFISSLSVSLLLNRYYG